MMTAIAGRHSIVEKASASEPFLFLSTEAIRKLLVSFSGRSCVFNVSSA